MTNALIGGVTYQVNPAGSDITSFNPSSDQLEFGQISVHGLILGAIRGITPSDPYLVLDFKGSG
mgnify:CR=1 FL=1